MSPGFFLADVLKLFDFVSKVKSCFSLASFNLSASLESWSMVCTSLFFLARTSAISSSTCFLYKSRSFSNFSFFLSSWAIPYLVLAPLMEVKSSFVILIVWGTMLLDFMWSWTLLCEIRNLFLHIFNKKLCLHWSPFQHLLDHETK